MTRQRAFTLLELLVVIGIIGVLAALAFAGLRKVKTIAQQAHCSNSLRQLGTATQLYLIDNDRRFFAYSKASPDGKLWYFGLESATGSAFIEGDRTLDGTKAPLYPYVRQVGGVEVCPSFPYGTAMWKPKFRGASWGYGFNLLLSNVHTLSIERPAEVILFGDCAQVNNFQPPASPNKPMVEEFYMIEQNYPTIHFRHGAAANLLFLDGHVQAMQVYPGTEDHRLPEANVGRITPKGSFEYLR